ncbi:MAG: multidrug MFS transporter [Clostridia bacterium]|jgi:UDP-N-acetylglucosamine transferase subunit ALG13|nr:multidrug MFS transporter [Clostridia bacterium]
MIFVTIGTHEQSFNRLVEYMDKWAEKHDEKVIIQTGYSTCEPEYCEWKRSYPYQKILQMVSEARIVITHGGPSSFIIPLESGKIPIVVPRKKQFHEHINDHQTEFSRQFAQRQGNIIVVENINDLGNIIENYENIVRNMKNNMVSNNESFCKNLESIVNELTKK